MVGIKNLVNYIIDYESGALNNSDTLELFSYLIQSNKAWGLQGHYGRIADSLINEGYIDKQGKILKQL